LPTILGSNSNLSTVDRQQATTAATAKRKEDDAAVVAAAQATVATVHREEEALVAVVAAARKTLDEARLHVAALAWKEKTISRHLEQHLGATQGIVIP
jgi:hypothetical protein